MLLWLVVGCLLPTWPGKEYRFIDRRATIFVSVVTFGAIAIRLQCFNCETVAGIEPYRACPHVGVVFATVTRIGRVWGRDPLASTALAPSCETRACKMCAVTRIGGLWDAILVTVDGFGALVRKKCARSHRFGAGGIPLGGGRGGGGRRTENRAHTL